MIIRYWTFILIPVCRKKLNLFGFIIVLCVEDSWVKKLFDILENNLAFRSVLVQIFLADLILVYWVPRNEGLRA
ncbi:hypothetical protein EFP54_15025 [Lacticaseibacillus paracasei]|nr:hypothetical protein [Lacticaseibacillus paracasei]MCT3379944.1 hypothetical protein [Lacticaseibacillus paracasei]RKW76299.1 hypothetical protein D9C00_15665 [Lacticaseibacillus paracasei]